MGYQPHVYTALNGEMPVMDLSLENDIPAEAVVIKRPIWEPYSVYKRFIGRKKDDKINAAFLNEGRKQGSIAEKISVWIRGNLFIPDARKYWIRPSARFLSSYVKQHQIKYVISSGPPHSMHLIARALKKEMPDLIWLADFRDPWTNIDFYDKLMLSPLADAKHKRLEKAVLREADAVISVGQHMSDEFKQILGQTQMAKKFVVLTNGFDEADLRKTDVPKDSKFSLAHIGTLVKDRNPEVLWRALQELVTENEAFARALEIKLVGKLDVFVSERIEHYQLSRFVRKINYLPHNEVIREQQASHINLLLVNNTPNAKGILTGKFFEYLAAPVPILAIGPPDGELAAIIRETGSGFVSDFEDVTGCKEKILRLFNGQGVQRNQAAINNYSRKAICAKLVNLLEVLGGRSTQIK